SAASSMAVMARVVMLVSCRWIGTQELQERRPVAQLGKRGSYGRIVLMTFEVDKKQVLPQSRACRARFEPAHTYAMCRERLQQCVDSTGPVVRRHHQRCLVATRRHALLPAQHPESRRVVRVIFDMRNEHVDTV